MSVIQLEALKEFKAAYVNRLQFHLDRIKADFDLAAETLNDFQEIVFWPKDAMNEHPQAWIRTERKRIGTEEDFSLYRSYYIAETRWMIEQHDPELMVKAVYCYGDAIEECIKEYFGFYGNVNPPKPGSTIEFINWNSLETTYMNAPEAEGVYFAGGTTSVEFRQLQQAIFQPY